MRWPLICFLLAVPRHLVGVGCVCRCVLPDAERQVCLRIRSSIASSVPLLIPLEASGL